MAREMKDSGIEWIGEIPKAWKVAPLKRFAKIQTGNTPSKAYEALFYADEGILWIKPDNLGTGSPITYTADYLTPEGRNVARVMPPNTVYVCCIGSLGKVGYSLVEGCCNQQINALIYNDRMYWKYGYYLTLAQESRYLLYGNGNVLQIINVTNQGNIECVVPSLSEQKDISNFLDGMCVEIDSVLEKTRSSIEEYKKLKQAVITQAVTKGIRGDREMKDSQSMWFGQIPDDWNMRKIKYIFKIQKDIAREEGHTVLSITQKGIKPKDLSKNEGQLAENYSNYQLVHIGDFAMNHMDLLTGWVDISKYEGVTSPDYRVFGLIDKDNYCCQYYLYLMQMCYTNRIFYGLGQGVSGLGRWRLQADKFLNFSITVPSYEEQQEIANYLNKKCSAIDELIAKKEQYLSEIENYKKSLIYEYVTGKKEVQQE